MKSRRFWGVFWGCILLALLATAWGSDGVVNDPGEVWQVRYNKGQPSETTKDIAIRIKVYEKNGKLLADLTRYDKLDNAAMSYQQRAGKSGKVVEIPGMITKSGQGSKRFREKFEFSKDYTGDNNEQRRVTIKGFHHGAKKKNDEADDSICVRIFDKALVAFGLAQQRDCDDLPPDEDNLNEESDMPEPPDYDGDGG
jgi:hypothetical protein